MRCNSCAGGCTRRLCTVRTQAMVLLPATGHGHGLILVRSAGDGGTASTRSSLGGLGAAHRGGAVRCSCSTSPVGAYDVLLDAGPTPSIY